MMGRRGMGKALFALAAAAVMLTGGAGLAQITVESGDRVESEKELDDMAFFSGGEIALSTRSSDDVFAAGGDVALREITADGLFVAAGSVSLDGVEARDVILAAGEAEMNSGGIADDVIATAGSLKIGSGFLIGGSAVLTGGEIEITSPIRDDLRAAGGMVTLNGPVGGDAKLAGGSVRLGPDAQVAGDLRVASNDLSIDDQAQIGGRLIRVEMTDETDAAAGVLGAFVGIVFFALGTALLAFFLGIFLGRPLGVAAEVFRRRPLASAGVGVITAIAAGPVLLLLLVSAVGIPLALTGILLLLAAFPLALATGAKAGQQIATGAEAGLAAKIGMLLVFSLALGVIGIVPVLGFAVLLLTGLVGTGAMVLALAGAGGEDAGEGAV